MILFGAKYLIFVIVAVAGVWFLYQPRGRQKEILVAGVLISLISFAVSRLAGLVYFDPRPFAVERVAPLIPHAADNGFPSDHALLGAAIALAVFRHDRRLGSLLLVMAVAVGAARVQALVHHPIDIAGSFAIALFAYAATFGAVIPAMRRRRAR